MPELPDLILRGASLVDGTGAPARPADVAVSGGRITAVGHVPPLAAGTDGVDGVDEVDLTGLVLAPGFIDPHTHYDAQVLWDRDVTPSSWHGVTTVITGNCGFTIAPTRPVHRDVIMRTLENVEGMPLPALEAGIPWDFETFPEYIDALEAEPTRLNLAPLIGHTALRFYVLGGEATERSATPQEVVEMCRILGEALDAGAVGFSTSRNQSHIGAYGKPVSSRLADLGEVWALARVLGDRQQGTIEATWGDDLFVDEFAQLAADVDRPVSWAALMTRRHEPGYALEIARRVEAAGQRVYPQIACRPIVVQITLADPAPLANVPAIEEILGLPRAERAARYAQLDWQERADAEVRERWGDRLDHATVEETTRHVDLVGGPTMGALAAARGVTPMQVMAELAVAEDLQTRFRVAMTNDDEDGVGTLLADHPRFLLGLSDAGAHTSQLCDANYATYLLGHWVRERGALPLEQAVWRLTGQPAFVYGLEGRGAIAVGNMADLVAFDPATVGPTPLERVHDFPGGADRLISRSTGVPHVWVRGTAIRRHGVDLADVRPGAVLRRGLEPA
jgi:N-acyl-D-amino-acid deacylase